MDNVANIIANQIRAIDRSAFMAWGVRKLINTGRGLSFKSTGMCRWKGHVTVTLNYRDLYDIKFETIRAGKIKLVKEVTDIFCDELVSVIDDQVG
jgi:hypothetical protein